MDRVVYIITLNNLEVGRKTLSPNRWTWRSRCAYYRTARLSPASLCPSAWNTVRCQHTRTDPGPNHIKLELWNSQNNPRLLFMMEEKKSSQNEKETFHLVKDRRYCSTYTPTPSPAGNCRQKSKVNCCHCMTSSRSLNPNKSTRRLRSLNGRPCPSRPVPVRITSEVRNRTSALDQFVNKSQCC